MATVTAIYRPFLVAVAATEKFPNLHQHGALNRADTVLISHIEDLTLGEFICLSVSEVLMDILF